MIESALNKNLTLLTKGGGRVNMNGQDLSSLAAGLLSMPAEHSGSRLSSRLEQVENSVAVLTADGDGRLATIEQSIATLAQAQQGGDDNDNKYRRLKRQVCV